MDEEAQAALAQPQWRLTPLFVKSVRRLTRHRQEIASLWPRELGDVVSKTPTTQACSGYWVMGEHDARSQR
jgi:hypothetical protein